MSYLGVIDANRTGRDNFVSSNLRRYDCRRAAALAWSWMELLLPLRPCLPIQFA